MNTLAMPAPAVRGPHLKLAALLGVAAALAALAVFPYLTAVVPPPATRLPRWAVAAVWIAQTGVQSWLAAWLGLFLGARHGLDAPWLRAWIYRGARPDPARAHWTAAAGVGLLVGLVVAGLSLLDGGLPKPPLGISTADWVWRGALASFYGGIAEETLCRVLLVSLLVWLLASLRRGVARPWMFAAAIVLAALLFGAGHLPAAFAAHMVHGVWSVMRIILLNAVVGIVSGVVFWRWGLEHAMLAHFNTDLVLHVAWPLIGG